MPTAVFGSKPKIRISIGVISEPPPIPVMPTSVPTARPAITNCQVTRNATPGIGHDTNGRPREAAAELVRLAAGAEAGGGGEERQRRNEKAERCSEPRDACGIRCGGGREHDEPDDIRRPRRARVLERALAEARLQHLEVEDAREADAAADRQSKSKLQREQR